MHRRIEVRRHLCDPLAQQFEITVHGESISPDSDIVHACVFGASMARSEHEDAINGRAQRKAIRDLCRSRALAVTADDRSGAMGQGGSVRAAHSGSERWRSGELASEYSIF
jgi:hypothetical protein